MLEFIEKVFPISKIDIIFQVLMSVLIVVLVILSWIMANTTNKALQHGSLILLVMLILIVGIFL